MHEHRRRDNEADNGGDVERKANAETIEEAVERECARTPSAALAMMMILVSVIMMQHYHAIEDKVHSEAERRDSEDIRRRAASELERFGQQIKKRDADDRTRRKSEDEVQTVAQLECKEAAEERHGEGSDGDEIYHPAMVLEEGPRYNRPMRLGSHSRVQAKRRNPERKARWRPSRIEIRLG